MYPGLVSVSREGRVATWPKPPFSFSPPLPRVFQEMFTEESAHSTAEPPSPPAAPPSAGVKKRPASWSRPGPKFPSKARSGKFRLEKMKIYKSESDSADGPVILASVSDLAHGGCGRIPQHEVGVVQSLFSCWLYTRLYMELFRRQSSQGSWSVSWSKWPSRKYSPMRLKLCLLRPNS